MRIYIFKSETRKGLQAFAGDLAGSRLPQQHGPWTATGAIGPEKAPPHNFSRDAIEGAIEAEGFQLWRLAKKTAAPAWSRAPWRHLPRNSATSRKSVCVGPARPSRNGTAKYCWKWPGPGFRRQSKSNVARERFPCAAQSLGQENNGPLIIYSARDARPSPRVSGERLARALSAFTRVFDALWRVPSEGQRLAMPTRLAGSSHAPHPARAFSARPPLPAPLRFASQGGGRDLCRTCWLLHTRGLARRRGPSLDRVRHPIHLSNSTCFFPPSLTLRRASQ